MIIDDALSSRSPETKEEGAIFTFSMQRFINFFKAPTERALRSYEQRHALDKQWMAHAEELVTYVTLLGRKYEDDRTAYVVELYEYFDPMVRRKPRPWWKIWAPRDRGLTRKDWSAQTERCYLDLRRHYNADNGRSYISWWQSGLGQFLQCVGYGNCALLHFFPQKEYVGEKQWNTIQRLVETCQMELKRPWLSAEPASPSITFPAALVDFIQSYAAKDEYALDGEAMGRLHVHYRQEIDTYFQQLRDGWMPKRIDLGSHDDDGRYMAPSDDVNGILDVILTKSPSEYLQVLLEESSSTQPPVQGE